MKRSTLFVIIVTFAMMSGRVWAYDFSAVAPTGQTLYYTIQGANVIVTHPGTSYIDGFWAGFVKPTGNLTIPNTVIHDGVSYTVTVIDGFSFMDCDSLTGVIIPNTVVLIRNYAFLECHRLSQVTIGSNVDSIGIMAFEYCYALTDITIPTSVTYIGQRAFANDTNLSVVNILSDSCRSFWSDPYNPSHPTGRTFERCWHLDTINIGANVRYLAIDFGIHHGRDSYAPAPHFRRLNFLGTLAQWYNVEFESINFNPMYWEETPILYTSDDTITTNMSKIILPSSVTRFKNAFYGVTIDTLIIPISVTNIGLLSVSKLFYMGTICQWCNIDFDEYHYCEQLYINDSLLTNLTIPSSINIIKPYTFAHCGSLMNVTLSNTITEIGHHAFAYCYLLNFIEVPPSVTEIGLGAFSYIDSVLFNIPNPLPMANGYGAEVILIPCMYYDTYQNNNIWNDLHLIEYQFPYQITANDTTMGMVVVNEMPNYTSDCNVLNIEAIANYGYHLSHWSDGDTSRQRAITVTQDTNLTACFMPNVYSVVVNNITPSYGTVLGDGSYPYGDTVMLIALPNEHYHFFSWTNTIYHYHTQTYYTDTLVFIITQDTTFELMFELDRHHVDATPNNIAYGTVWGAGDYGYGTAASISAQAYSGYQFLRWSNGVTYNPYTFAVLCDTSLTAIFAEEGTTYVITGESADPSMGSVTGGSNYALGEQATLTALPNSGYIFDHWQDNNTENPRTITVTSDATYTAYFVETQGIDDVFPDAVNIYTLGGRIVVETELKEEIGIYDIVGHKVDGGRKNRFNVPVSGVYLVKIGSLSPVKVVVVK
ncbi:MAG: leucine-rich repeat protein [Bacteroidales bacterium]|nr:leucine-rich repeat protein [Bacteroidales bacterium]